MNAKRAAAMIAIKASSKDLDKGLGEARKKLRTFGSSIKKIGGKIWGGGKGALSSIGTGLGIQAATGITETITSIRDFERNLVRLQIASGKSAPEMERLRASIIEVSRATGVANDDILAGTQTYVDLTGDVDGATAAMSSFARIAQASGSSVGDVATATAALKQSMNLDSADIEAAFSGLIQQGKAGAVSLKDFAGELSKLAPKFAKFGGASGLTGIADLGAAFQITRQGFGSASEAATGMSALMTAMSRNAGIFAKAEVKIFDKDPKTGVKRFKSFRDIVDQIGASKLAKDPEALTKAFGSVEAQQAFDMLSKNRGELEKLYSAGLDAGAVQRDLNTYLESSAGRLDQAMNNLKIAIVEAFTPERIAAFVEMVEKVASAIGTVIDGLSDLKDMLSDKDEVLFNPYLKGEEAYSDGTNSLDAAAAAGDPFAMQKKAKADAFNKTMGDIQGAGGREEKIRAAVVASRNYVDGTNASRAAGDAYLGHKGVSADKIDMIDRELKGEQLAKMIGDRVREAMKGMKVEVKMDSSAVAKTTDNAPSHRGGGW
jgi:TP901 family phage tail tape measure protein